MIRFDVLHNSHLEVRTAEVLYVHSDIYIMFSSHQLTVCLNKLPLHIPYSVHLPICINLFVSTCPHPPVRSLLSVLPSPVRTLMFVLSSPVLFVQLQGTQELFELSSAFENSVVPQEYGTDREDKRRIGSKMCNALLEKIKYDLTITMVRRLHVSD